MAPMTASELRSKLGPDATQRRACSSHDDTRIYCPRNTPNCGGVILDGITCSSPDGWNALRNVYVFLTPSCVPSCSSEPGMTAQPQDNPCSEGNPLPTPAHTTTYNIHTTRNTQHVCCRECRTVLCYSDTAKLLGNNYVPRRGVRSVFI